MSSIKNSPKYFSQLDGLRFFALVSVTIGHWIAWETDNYLIKVIPWSRGVILFFVLSGYLISDILMSLREKIDTKQITFANALKSFYVRRLLRIFPPYYFLIFFLLYYSYENINEIKFWLFTFSTNILMCFKYSAVGDAEHLWSLAVEEQFYIIWPFVILLIGKNKLLKFISLIIIISLLSRIVSYSFYPASKDPAVLNYFTLNLFLPLALGGILAYSKNYATHLYQYFNNYYLLILSILIYIACFYFFGLIIRSDFYWLVFDEYLFAIACLFIVCRASQNKFKLLPKIILENEVIVFLGKISYGLYLYHMFMGKLFWQIIVPKFTISVHNHFEIWCFYFALLVFVALASYYLIEKPINNLKKYFSY
jgi:peptidoglycan/LPS O-acetylase OafA/YrhL